MKSSIVTIYIYILFLHCSCSNNNHIAGGFNTIHFKENNIKLFDSLEFRFVQLETNPNCLIGYINHIEIFDDRIFIHDLYFSKSIFVFNANGHFITQIGSRGSGPESYITPYGFEIDKKNKKIIISDLDRKRLVFYDLDTYKYITHKDCPFSYTDFFISENRFYFFSHYGFEESRKDNYVLVTDTLFNPIFKDWKCDFKTYRNQLVSDKLIYNIKEQTFAYHHLQPYIYEIANNECRIHTKLSFENLEFPTINKSIDPTSFQYMDELDNSTKEISAFGIYESNNTLFIQLTIGKMPHFAIYNKKTNMPSFFNGKDFINSIGLDALALPQGATDDEIICMITTGQKINKEKIKVAAFAALIDEIKEDDNPVLCFMKWKQ